MYLLHHEEIESLAQTIPGVKRIRFFMTFGQSYLDHMRCLEDVGMLSTTPINYNGQEIVPIQFLKALLPDPASLGPVSYTHLVGFQSKAFMTNGRRAEPGSRAKACGRIKGRSVKTVSYTHLTRTSPCPHIFAKGISSVFISHRCV